LPIAVNEYQRHATTLKYEENVEKETNVIDARKTWRSKLEKEGKEILWKVRNHQGVEAAIIQAFSRHFCMTPFKSDQVDFSEEFPLLLEPSKLFKFVVSSPFNVLT
jgi:hypothetical protein